jgi:hypothetical protein
MGGIMGIAVMGIMGIEGFRNIWGFREIEEP